MSALRQTAIIALACGSFFVANGKRVLAQDQGPRPSSVSTPKLSDPIAAAAIKKIEGVYKTRFANSTVHDEHFTSENILEIVPYDGDKIYFRVHLEFYNAHLCDLVGIAAYEGGKFVFRIPNDAPADGCELAISQAGRDIVLEDVGGNCKTYACGARGGFQGSGFPMKARREIKYMKLLKSSREYLDAIAAFEESAQTSKAPH